MTKTAKRARSVICTLLAFILSLSVTLTLACATLALSALNPDFAVRVVARSQYSEHLAAELKEEFISYGNACNMMPYSKMKLPPRESTQTPKPSCASFTQVRCRTQSTSPICTMLF